MSQPSVALRGDNTLDWNPILSLTGLSDVRIQTARVPSRLDGATAEGVLWQAAPGRFLLRVPGVARFLVQEGRSLTIDSEPGVRPSELHRFLRMTPLAALLYQRGALAFHAAAAANADGVVLLAGDSGAGKSALLMALVQRGWTRFADELTIVETDEHGSLQVVPTFPEIYVPGRTLPIPNPGADSPQRLRAIHWLTVHNEERVDCRELNGLEGFRALGSLTYNTRIADALLNRTTFFTQAAHIAQTVSIRRWFRPRGRDTVEELADRLVRFSIPLPSIPLPAVPTLSIPTPAHNVRSAASGARP